MPTKATLLNEQAELAERLRNAEIRERETIALCVRLAEAKRDTRRALIGAMTVCAIETVAFVGYWIWRLS
jgi:hypothetical protein